MSGLQNKHLSCFSFFDTSQNFIEQNEFYRRLKYLLFCHECKTPTKPLIKVCAKKIDLYCRTACQH